MKEAWTFSITSKEGVAEVDMTIFAFSITLEVLWRKDQGWQPMGWGENEDLETRQVVAVSYEKGWRPEIGQ